MSLRIDRRCESSHPLAPRLNIDGACAYAGATKNQITQNDNSMWTILKQGGEGGKHALWEYEF